MGSHAAMVRRFKFAKDCLVTKSRIPGLLPGMLKRPVEEQVTFITCVAHVRYTYYRRSEYSTLFGSCTVVFKPLDRAWARTRARNRAKIRLGTTFTNARS